MRVQSAFAFTILVVGCMAVSTEAVEITVISNAVEDLNHLQGDAQNRGEMILNNTGTNSFRFGAVRYDVDILGVAAGAPDFTDPLLFELTSATLTLTEQASRDANNGTQSGRVGAYFLTTIENTEWTVASAASVNSGNAGPDDPGPSGDGWFGNSLARPGNFGGGATGANNADNRSNGAANPLVSFWDGTSFVDHTFVEGNDAETVTIDLTAGGASLPEIQSILGDWVAGSNAGIGLGGEFGNQSFWQSNNVPGGLSVGSTIDGDSTFSGLSMDDGTGEGGIGADGPGAGTSFLTLTFDTAPIPGDVDGDGLVNSVDYDIILANFFTVQTERTAGDLVNNDFIDLDDYLQWKTAPHDPDPPGAAGVPEPTSALLFLLAIVGLGFVRWR